MYIRDNIYMRQRVENAETNVKLRVYVLTRESDDHLQNNARAHEFYLPDISMNATAWDHHRFTMQSME